MNHIVENIYTNCTLSNDTKKNVEGVFFDEAFNSQVISTKANTVLIDRLDNAKKLVLNVPGDKQKPIIEIKEDNFYFIPNYFIMYSEVRNVELYLNDEYVKTLRGVENTSETQIINSSQEITNTISYFTHKYEFPTKKDTYSVKLKFITGANSESLSLYAFHLWYDPSTHKKIPPTSSNDISIDFNNVREMLAGIQISDDAQHMLNHIESSSKILNAMGGLNPELAQLATSSLANNPNSIIWPEKGKEVSLTTPINPGTCNQKENQSISPVNIKSGAQESTVNEQEIMASLKRIENRMDIIESKLDMILSRLSR